MTVLGSIAAFAVGIVLLLTQIFTLVPDQRLAAGGVLLALCGICFAVDVLERGMESDR